MIARWFDQSRCPIGIDFGASSIKMMQLRQQANGFRIQAAVARSLPESMPDDAAQRVEVQVNLLREMLASEEFAGRDVVSSLPAASLQFKNLRLPSMPPDELRSAVEWEASERFNLSSHKAHLQYFDAGEVRQGDETRREIILIAAPTTLVQEHLDTLVQIGLRPVAIECAPSALARFMTVLESPEPFDPDAAGEVVIDLGYRTTKVTILRHGRVTFFKLIDIGAKHLDEAVAAALNLSLTEAADVRRRLHVETRNAAPEEGGELEDAEAPQPSDETSRKMEHAVFDAVRMPLSELAREVGLCMRYHSVTFRGRRLERAVLVGGEARNHRAIEILSQDAGLTVESCGAGRVIGLNDAPEAAYHSGVEAWAVAAGLSMRSTVHTARRRDLRGAA